MSRRANLKYEDYEGFYDEFVADLYFEIDYEWESASKHHYDDEPPSYGGPIDYETKVIKAVLWNEAGEESLADEETLKRINKKVSEDSSIQEWIDERLTDHHEDSIPRED